MIEVAPVDDLGTKFSQKLKLKLKLFVERKHLV